MARTVDKRYLKGKSRTEAIIYIAEADRAGPQACPMCANSLVTMPPDLGTNRQTQTELHTYL